MAELVRGRTATVIGDVTAVLALQKALPLAYNRDLQEDKAIVFHADDTVAAALEAMVALIGGTRFEPPLPGSSVLALDLAEVLVARGVPFRRAHAVVARLVTRLAAEGRQLGEVTAAELSAADPSFETRGPGGARRDPVAGCPPDSGRRLAGIRRRPARRPEDLDWRGGRCLIRARGRRTRAATPSATPTSAAPEARTRTGTRSRTARG